MTTSALRTSVIAMSAGLFREEDQKNAVANLLPLIVIAEQVELIARLRVYSHVDHLFSDRCRRQTMKMQRRFLFAFVVLVLFLTLQTSRLIAQDAPEPPDAQQEQQGPEQDPPTRVARLNYSSGSVSFQPGGEGDWVTAVQNRPLTTGDNLWADQNSRAEVHVGSTAIRMASETSLTFLDLDDHTTQLRLSLGTLLIRVRHLDDGDLFEVDTPNLAFTIQSAGEYRIDVNSEDRKS